MNDCKYMKSIYVTGDLRNEFEGDLRSNEHYSYRRGYVYVITWGQYY